MRRSRLIVLIAAATTALPSAPARAADPLTDWLSYSRAATYGAIVTNVRPTMRDGVQLGCRMAVPATNGQRAAGEFPGIVTNVVPYAAFGDGLRALLRYYAERGYQAIQCDVRGTGASGGFFATNNQQAEWRDSYDLVEWLAAQPGSNGRIGQEGESYGGMTSLEAAIMDPPHLAAIAPQQAAADLYDDAVYPGGVKTRPGVVDAWPLVAAGLSSGRVNPSRIWRAWFAHPTHDAFWDDIAVAPKLGRVRVPVLTFGGWADPLFRRGSLRLYEQFVRVGHGAKTWMVTGPWEHGYLLTSPFCAALPVCLPKQRLDVGVVLAWFDHWLGARPDAPLPPARVLTNPGSGWEQLDRWPPADAGPLMLALNTDGSMSEEAGPSGSRSYLQRPTSGLLAGTPSVRFVTAPLAGPTVLAGDVILKLRATLDRPAANLRAVLRERLADGRVATISDGWRRLTGQPQADVEIWPTHRPITPGSRLELTLSGGGAVEVLPVPWTVRTDVATGSGGSALELSIRGGGTGQG